MPAEFGPHPCSPTMRRPLLPVLFGATVGASVAAAAWAIAPMAARAHAIQTDLQLLGPGSANHQHVGVPSAGSRLQLASHFSTGLPARDAAVRLIPNQGGTPIELGRTDAEGRLAFALPARTGADAEIQVDAGAGHRDWIELTELGRSARQAALPWASLRGNLFSLAPVVVLGVLGGLARLHRPRG